MVDFYSLYFRIQLIFLVLINASPKVIQNKSYKNVIDTEKSVQNNIQTSSAEINHDHRPIKRILSNSAESSAVEIPTDPFLLECFQAHNEYRSRHGSPPLLWSETIAQSALLWAQEIATKNFFAHGVTEYGENLAYLRNYTLNAENTVGAWYEEIKDYDWSKPVFSGETGHFTQVIWENTKYVGIAHAKSAYGADFIVARYSPKGNYEGEFEKNVKPLIDIIPADNNPIPAPPILPLPSTTNERVVDINNFGQFKILIQNHHRDARAKLNLTDLKWDMSIEELAQKNAKELFDTGYITENFAIKSDQIILSFDGYIPSIQNIFNKINYDQNIHSSRTQINKNIHPLCDPKIDSFSFAQMSDKIDQLVAVFIYTPGTNKRITVSIKKKKNL